MKALNVLFLALLAVRIAGAADDNRVAKVYTLKDGSQVAAQHTAIFAVDGKVSYKVTDFSGKNRMFDSTQIANIGEQPWSRFNGQASMQNLSPASNARLDTILGSGNLFPWQFDTLVLGPNGLSLLGSFASGVPGIFDGPVIGLRPGLNPDGTCQTNSTQPQMQTPHPSPPYSPSANTTLTPSGLVFTPHIPSAQTVQNADTHPASAVTAGPISHNHPPAPTIETPVVSRLPEAQAVPSHVSTPAAPLYSPPSHTEPSAGGGAVFTGRR